MTCQQSGAENVTEEECLRINPNTADAETLGRLPSVGRVIAQRIVATRPFENLDDLQRVNGIGPVVLQRMWPFLTLLPSEVRVLVTRSETLEMVAAPPKADPAPEPIALEARPASEGAPVHAQEPRPAMVTRAQASWMVAWAVLLASILTLALSLGILASLNGGRLRFATPWQLNELAVQVTGFGAQVEVQGQDVERLRTRLNNLGALSARISTVEQASDQLRVDAEVIATEVEGLTKQANDLEAQVEGLTKQANGLETEIEALQTQGDRFQAFLDGLRDLLDDLFKPKGGVK